MSFARFETAAQLRARLNRQAGECTWCGKKVSGRRQTWCSDDCVHQYKLRNDVGYAGRAVRKRDHGVCANCGLDSEQALEQLRWLNKELLAKEPQPPGLYRWVHPRVAVLAEGLGYLLTRRVRYFAGGKSEPYYVLEHCPWHADHIVPVCEGGGQCDIDGLRTLCLKCHKYETALLAARRKARRERDQDG